MFCVCVVLKTPSFLLSPILQHEGIANQRQNVLMTVRASSAHGMSSKKMRSFPSISPPVSPLRYGMVGTVAGDGAPRSLSVVRSSGVRWACPFSFSDSSLVGLRPFSQLMTTVSPLLTSRQLHLVHNNICSKPIFTKFNRLSILVANSQLFILVSKDLQHLPTYGTSVAFPFGRMTCVLSALPTSP